MPYIGRPIGVAGHTTQKLDDPASISSNAFVMKVGTVAISPDAASLQIYVDGVRQEAGVAYTVSGSTITFTGTFTSGNDFQGYVMGDAMYIQTNSVDSDHYVDGSIDNAHLADMAANTVKVRDANSSGVPSDKAVADTQLLIGDGTGFTAAALSGDVTMANTGAVTIANTAVENAMLADNAADTAEIADNAVTLAKMAGLARGKIIYGDSSGDPAALALGTDNHVLTVNGSDINWEATQSSAAAAGTLTGSTLASGVTASSLTSVGTLTSITSTGLTTIQPASDPGDFEALRLYNQTNQIYMTFHRGGTERGRIGTNASDLYIQAMNSGDVQIVDDGGIGVIVKEGGSVGIGTQVVPSSSQAGFWVQEGFKTYIGRGSGTGAETSMVFVNGNGAVGTVTTNGSNTAYNTTSDYRLKENEVSMSDGLSRINQLKPYRFNFKADPDRRVDGFFAHEVSDIVAEAVAGDKDALRTEEYEVEPAVLDDDENIVTEAVMGEREVIDPQGIDQSKIVPLLVAAVQELSAKVEALES